MNFFRVLPVVISFVLLAAHFLRAGQTVVMLISLALILFLFVKQHWVPRLLQLALLLGAIEWVVTLVSVAQMRIEFGMPWTRMAIILGTVALFTLLSGLVFRTSALRQRYDSRPGTVE